MTRSLIQIPKTAQFFSVCIFFLIPYAFSQTLLQNYQPSLKEYRFFANDSLGPFKLPDSFLVTNSITIFAGEKLLERKRDYEVNEIKGILYLKSYFPAVELTVRYKALNLKIPTVFRYKKEFEFSNIFDTLQIKKESTQAISQEDQTTGYQLQRSGSILRAITIGTGEDIGIESSMRLELDGNLTEDLEIKAVLSDQTSGITPEGNTKTLKELDRIYIQTKSPTNTVTMGDYPLQFGQSNPFVSTKKQVQGAQWIWEKPRLQTQVLGAITRARYRTVQFVANEGNQGPYLLTDGEQNLPTPIVPGSERVFIDGVEQTRGQTENYTIDYSTGEITFTPKTPIRQDARIIIEYETIPGYYNRGIFATQVSGRTIGRNFVWSAGVYSESDDAKNPVGYTLTDSAKQALQNAGDNPLYSFYNSERYVGPNQGDYKKIDTLYQGNQIPIYVFVPPDSSLQPQGEYEVTFTKVPNGDYQIDFHSLSAKSFYKWVGTGLGDYLPIIKIPLPQKREVAAVATQLRPNEFVKVQVESAMSKFDANTMSIKNGKGIQGGAIAVETQLNAPSFKGVHHFQTTIKYKEVESNFRPLERVDNIEEYRRWGNTDTLSQSGQITKEVEFSYSPVQLLNLKSSIGNQQKDDGTRSKRLAVSISTITNLWKGVFATEKIQANQSIQQTDIEIVRLFQQQSLRVKQFQSSFQTNFENYLSTRTYYPMGSRKLSNSFTFIHEFHPSHTLNLSITRRNDWNRISKIFHPSLRSLGFQIKHDLSKRNFISNTEYHHNETRYLPSDSLVKVDLIQSIGSAKFYENIFQANWNYSLNATSTSKLLLYAYPVPLGQGTHVKIGEQFVPNPEGDWIVFTRPSGDYEPVVDFNVTLGITSFLERLQVFPWKGVTSDTRVEIGEQSKTKHPMKLMLFYLPEFLSEKTLNGRQTFKQDFTINPTKVHFWKFRTTIQRDKSNRWLTGAYDNRFSSFSLFYRNNTFTYWTWSIETQYEKKIRSYQATSIANRLTNNYKINPSIIYFQQFNQEYKLDAIITYSNDQYQRLHWYETGITPSFTYYFKKSGRLYMELEWRAIFSNALRLPYDLSNGRQPGNNWRWMIRNDIRLGANVNGALYYRGVKDYSYPIRNEGRAEITAFF
ncbi:MAG: hypothetical protein N2450_09375 [bacterium]|nr:hypothetical protein [bacterium]